MRNPRPLPGNVVPMRSLRLEAPAGAPAAAAAELALCDLAEIAEISLDRLRSSPLSSRAFARARQAREDALARLCRATVENQADAMAAIRVVLLRVQAEAEEDATPGNALEYHLLGQVSSFLHKLGRSKGEG